MVSPSKYFFIWTLEFITSSRTMNAKAIIANGVPLVLCFSWKRGEDVKSPTSLQKSIGGGASCANRERVVVGFLAEKNLAAAAGVVCSMLAFSCGAKGVL